MDDTEVIVIAFSDEDFEDDEDWSHLQKGNRTGLSLFYFFFRNNMISKISILRRC